MEIIFRRLHFLSAYARVRVRERFMQRTLKRTLSKREPFSSTPFLAFGSRSQTVLTASASPSVARDDDAAHATKTNLIARSIAELNKLKGRAKKLLIPNLRDNALRCQDVICQNFSKPCLCKLSIALEQNGKALTEIDLSACELTSVPETLFTKCENLERVSLSNNDLSIESIEKHYLLRKLKLIELGGNPRLSLTVECYNRLAKRNVKVRI